MKILALDMSMECTGYALYENDNLITHGSVSDIKYKGMSNERYPQKTSRVIHLMVNKIVDVISAYSPDLIVIEEVSVGGLAGIKSIKGLCGLHFVLMNELLMRWPSMVDKVRMIGPSGKDGWRVILGLKKNGDWKASSVKMCNEKFGIGLVSGQHDIADAVLIGHAYTLLKHMEDV